MLRNIPPVRGLCEERIVEFGLALYSSAVDGVARPVRLEHVAGDGRQIRRFVDDAELFEGK